MKTFLLLGLGLLMTPAGATPGSGQAARTLAPSAQVDVPPSAAKLSLIRRYLRAIGVQRQLDTGSLLERYAWPGGPVRAAGGESLLGDLGRQIEALREAYEPYRAEYQRAYESHVNWEFTEEELVEIVGFLEAPVGQHFLDGRWRMDAYVQTEMEELEERIVREAIARLAD